MSLSVLKGDRQMPDQRTGIVAQIRDRQIPEKQAVSRDATCRISASEQHRGQPPRSADQIV